MMVNFIKRIVFIWLVAFAFLCEAEVVVNVNKGVMRPVSVALNFFDFGGDIKDNFSKVVGNDLQGTFLFRLISEGAFMQLLKGVNQRPTFPLWKIINAQYLVNAELKIDSGRLLASFVLYDVLSETPVGTFSASGDIKEWRKLAHLVSNSIYERVTGEVGYFDTKILYVAVQKQSRGKKTYRLAIMDQDGYDHKFLTNGDTIVLTPRFSPNGREFSFFSYREKIVNGRRVPISASVYRYDLTSKRTELIAHFDGMTYAPRYSPGGNLLIFSLSHRGSSSIYTFDLVTRHLTRLTKGRCIDTSPCYSPDGRYIVFNSDRGGNQQLYIMDADGSNIRRLSFSNGRYATPVWSPRNDWIAFTKFGGSGFYIGIIHPDGSGERMLASGHLVEGPTWSPNGRVIMFSHQDYAKREKIFSVDITGYNKREIPTPHYAIDPEWSAKNKILYGTSDI
ncbi:MAG: Tol-Pal system beta propeller repeat protein TolB [Holosporaceae bacterium]|jgi:TolB protein|nr:Tol-Pal system beta propeller repeat protein TolB [Holosporaceae bacterium]